MSKKTRKKSPKTPSAKSRRTSTAKSAAAKTARGSKASVKKPPAKAGKAVAKGTGTRVGKKPAKTAKTASANKTASAKASHKAPSKSLKSSPSAPPKEALQPAREEIASVPQSRFGEGAKAPAFRLPRDGGDSVSLADYAGKKLVLFFYPRADTPGCTREAIDFTRLSGEFADQGTAVLGVSADSVKAQESFRDKHQLSVPLISDEKHEMLEAYEAWGEKSMYGRSFMGIIRTTVLIGADGRIAKIWRNVRVDGHADEVLTAVREL
jgi:thioredoxin-dependent peroxiredoxin